MWRQIVKHVFGDRAGVRSPGRPIPDDRPGAGRSAAPWAPTHRHRKGGLYRVLSDGIYEPDRSAVVIYDDVDGSVWVRPASEFWDGRFATITTVETG